MRTRRCRTAAAAILLAALACGATSTATAETVDDQGLWLAFLSQGAFSDDADSPWKWWFDAHARFFDDADGFGQSILRPGIGYEIAERTTLWAGYGWINTAPAARSNFDENRVWQQLTWSTDVGPATWALRSRLEQRFLETGSDTGWRWRQFVRMRMPIVGGPRDVYFVAWDEVFVNFNDTDWGARSGFNQNRLFIGFGRRRQRCADTRIEIGYLNQAINPAGGDNLTNHILSFNYFFQP